MDLIVNDAPLSLPDGATVAALVVHLGLTGARVAVEVNRTLVRRADHAASILKADDRVEVVTLVGGG